MDRIGPGLGGYQGVGEDLPGQHALGHETEDDVDLFAVGLDELWQGNLWKKGEDAMADAAEVTE